MRLNLVAGYSIVQTVIDCYLVPIFGHKKKVAIPNLVVKLSACLCLTCGPSLLGQSFFTSRGTVIVVKLDKDRILAGADSMELGGRTGVKGCKLTRLGENLIFGGAGSTYLAGGNNTGLTEIYDAHAIAKQAFDKFKQNRNSDLRTRQIANEWGRVIRGRIKTVISTNPGNKPPLDNVQGVFIGSTVSKRWSIYTVNIDILPSHNKKGLLTVSCTVRSSVPTPPYDAAFVGAGGPYAAEFYASQTERAIEARGFNKYIISKTPGIDAIEFTMESAITAAEQWAPPEAGVGGDIDVIELKHGSIRWIKVKDQCKQ